MDKILLDREYYSYNNYAMEVQKYHVVPLITPKKGISMKKLEKLIPYHLFWFSTKEGKKKIEQQKTIMATFKRLVEELHQIARERAVIEDVFKFGKGILPFER